MKRRDSLKAITLTSLAGFGIGVPEAKAGQVPPTVPGGRTKEEAIRDAELMKQQFFIPAEMQTIRLLCDIIIPADSRSGSASEAKVPEFIEFIVKDKPEWQTPLRGGLRWLDVQCNKRFQKPFATCTKAQQLALVDDIAYPERARPEMSQGVAFFNSMRNLTATGFFTSKVGIKDLGYVGNTPNNWPGVPDEVLAKYGLSYG